MTWPETYSKYKDIELMDEFIEYLRKQPDFETWSNLKLRTFIKNMSIKMWWGFILCFAETKGISIVSGMGNYLIQRMVDAEELARNFGVKSNAEKTMTDVTDKFFEVANG